MAWGKPTDYLWSALTIAAMTAVGHLLLEVIDLGNIALLYLVPVMFAAATYGLRAGLFAGLVSSLAYNFFFLPPDKAEQIVIYPFCHPVRGNTQPDMYSCYNAF